MYKDFNTISKVSTDLNAIKQSIKNILLTPKGSLPGKPNFGSYLYRIVFEQLDGITETLAKNYTIEALREFEDRIIVNNVIITKDEALHKLIIKIIFTYITDDRNREQTSTSIGISL